MPTEPSYGEHTRAVHLPPPPAPEQRPLGLPVYRTAAFAFSSSQEYADLLRGRAAGYVYSREANPTVDAFAAGVAALEGAEAGDGFASGMAATATVLMALCHAGSHVVAARELYGGTYGLLTTLLPRFGVTASFVDARDPAAVRGALRDDTALLWAETLANPTMTVADVPVLAAVAREAGVPLVVDSTFASPAVCRPLAHGADLVVHSATKYLGGHSDVTGGVVVGPAALVERVRHVRAQLGGSLSPDDAFLLHRGLATLPLRMGRHSASAQAVAEVLAGHPRVRAVLYPGLPDHPDHALAGKLFSAGRYGGCLALVVPGGRGAAAAVCDSARLAAVASSLGGTHTKLSPVVMTTHRQLDDSAFAAAGIDPGTIRVSVGLEDPDDLVADLTAALDTAVTATP
jgi:cystathionine beta-lyase/cystathionine gamma-synthase